MTEFERALDAAFGRSCRAARAARGVHDVPRRRPGRLAGRNARQRRNRRGARHREGAGVPVTMLGGGSNVLIADAGIRGLVIRPRGGEIERIDETRVRADAAVTINGLVRWTIMHGGGGPRSLGGHPWHGRRRGLRQRAFRRTADRRSDRPRCGSSDATGDQPTSRRRRWRSATIAAACRTRRGAAVGDVSRVAGRSGARCARRRGSRWRFASGRSRSTRRAPAASFRTRSRAATRCRTASRGRPARSSIAPG